MHKFDEVVMISARLENIGACPDDAAARESGDSGGGDSCQKFAIWQATAARLPAKMFPHVRRGAVLRSCRMNRMKVFFPIRLVWPARATPERRRI